MRTFLIGAALAVMVSCAGASAAEFKLLKDHPQRCVMSLSGEIRTGDLDALKAFIRDEVTPLNLPVIGGAQGIGAGPAPRICLDSPGGSLAEAVRMALYIKEGYSEADGTFALRNMGTMVAAGDACNSACSILFLAGQASEGDHGNYPDRRLHVQGTLGFHAPSLDVPDGDYSKASVDKAFRLAVRAISQLMSRSVTLEMAPELIDQMLSVPPETLGLLDTVAAAQAYNVTLTGLPVPRGLTRERIAHACELARHPSASLSVSGTRADGSAPDFYLIYRGMDRTWNRFEEEGRTVRFEMGVFDEGGYTCSGEIGRTDQNALWGSVVVDDWGGDGTTFSSRAQAWKFYPPQMPLSDIAAIMSGRDELTADVVFPGKTVAHDTVCGLFENGTLMARSACTMSFQESFHGDATRSYLWKTTFDGQKVTITARGARHESGPQIMLNGVPATVDPAIDSTSLGLYPSCVGAGERAFCFETRQ